MERIALAREYRVAEWLRDAYLELSQETSLDLGVLRPTEPCSNPDDRDWEADAKKWEAVSRDWEMLARISQIQMKAALELANSRISSNSANYKCCTQCSMYSYSNRCMMTANCRVLAITAMVDESFRGELESLRENPEHVEPPLPCKLPISYLYPLKTILYSQRHSSRSTKKKKKKKSLVLVVVCLKPREELEEGLPMIEIVFLHISKV
jgi:hypothetical protein